MFIQIPLIILGFIFLIKGADFLVDGSKNIAKKLHIPEIIIGLTIVSIGTSMPELFVSTTSAIQGYADISVGNIIGSNICNLLLILGLTAMIRPIDFQKQTVWIENPVSIMITIFFLFLCNSNSKIARAEGITLLIVFILFLLYTIFMGKREEKSDTLIHFGETKKISTLKNIMLIILGIIILKVGGEMVVENAKKVATTLKVSEKIISLTIVAIGTSLPELFTSITAGIKGDSDIAIGNIVGSNIFNILFIIGVSATICPIKYNITYNSQMIILLAGTTIMTIFPFVKPKKKLSRIKGMVCVLLYIFYIIELIIN